MSEPRYKSEYLDDFIAEEEIKPKTDGKINWKYLLILLLPFGTLLLIGLLIFKKLNKRKNSNHSIKKLKT